jgi:hypothetical protein
LNLWVSTITSRSPMYEAKMNMPGVVVDNKVVHAGNLPGPDPVRQSTRE